MNKHFYLNVNDSVEAASNTEDIDIIETFEDSDTESIDSSYNFEVFMY